MKRFQKNTTIDEMLRVKTFKQLLADGDIFDAHGASDRTGYVIQHVRLLCREGRIGHFTRSLPDAPDQVQFYFYPENLAELFSY